MRVSREEKARSRQRIVASAARIARERGIERTSVGEVMEDAGLTHGGFYRHFDSKEVLMETALDAAFDDMMAGMEAALAHDSPAQAVAAFSSMYLSSAHLQHAGRGCPVAALGAEVARESDDLKSQFGAGVRRMIDAISRGMPGDRAAQRTEAARRLAMMAGAVMIARASDPQTARLVLTSARSALREVAR